jgi:3,5-epimerase/4-reductase
VLPGRRRAPDAAALAAARPLARRSLTAALRPQVFLVYGRTGWIGGLLGELLTARGARWSFGAARLEDRAAVAADLAAARPTHVLNAAGRTGRPNVDWCEAHRAETLRANVIGCLTLADIAAAAGVHVTYFGTGCIFEYDAAHPVGGPGFTETDAPNFRGSYYSHTKAAVEDLLAAYTNVLTLRVRMPIVADLTYPRNFIAKIIAYKRVVDVPNSMTVLPELLPAALSMAERKITGIVNFTNPGAVSHNEILAMYRDAVDPDFTWENFSLEEQAKVIVAARSNNELDTARLEALCPGVLPIKASLQKFVFAPAAARREEVCAAVRAMRGR